MLVQDTFERDTFIVSWPVFTAGNLTNRSAGISICLADRYFNVNNIISVADPPIALSGRVAAIRLKKFGLCDLLVFVAYMPPQPCGRGHGSKANLTVRSMLKWMSEVMLKAPRRCIPLVLLDSNARLGLQREAATASWVPSSSWHVGDAFREQESATGRLLREFMEQHELCALNTYDAHSAGPTWFANSSSCSRSSRIDFILIPSTLWGEVQRVEVCKNKGLRIQKHSSSFANYDHVPVAAWIGFHSFKEPQFPKRIRWDLREFRQSDDTIRSEWLDSLRERLQAREWQDNWTTLLDEGDLDKLWAVLQTTLRETSQIFQCTPGHAKWEFADDTIAKRCERQDCRQEMIDLMRDYSTNMRENPAGFILQMWQMRMRYQRLDKQLYALRRRDKQKQQNQLASDLREAAQRHNSALVWQLARRIGHASKRRFLLPGSVSELEQWREHLGRSGPKGGWEASEIFSSYKPVSNYEQTGSAVSRAHGLTSACENPLSTLATQKPT